MIYQITVTVTAPVNPTEDPDRVQTAIQNLFPTVSLRTEPETITGTTHSIDTFAEKLSEQDIMDTARNVFHENSTTGAFSFRLKKQAALMGIVNFAVGNEDELGDITVHITVAEPTVDTFIDQLSSLPPNPTGP